MISLKSKSKLDRLYNNKNQNFNIYYYNKNLSIFQNLKFCFIISDSQSKSNPANLTNPPPFQIPFQFLSSSKAN